MEKPNPKQANNNLNKKTNIDELCLIEEDILCLGNNINELLNILKLALEGKKKCNEECKNKLKEIFTLIDKIKTNMHKMVDEIYSKKNFIYCSKISNDLREKEKEIHDIIIPIFKSYCLNDRSQNIQSEKKFPVNKK